MQQHIGLVLHAPIQSWGGVNMPRPNAKSPRNTENIPTKSAVIGMIRSALGVSRGMDDEHDLSSLRVLIRVDNPGKIKRDYQVAQRAHHGYNAGQNREIPKYHLQDATFVMLLSHSSPETLEVVRRAVEAPQWALFYGRRSHVPALPPLLGSVELEDPRSFLRELPLFWGPPSYSGTEKRSVRIYDSEISTGDQVATQSNEPLSFNPKRPQYGLNSLGFHTAEFSRTENVQVINQYSALKSHFQG